ncbi:MAG: M48 family metallopeptidase [Candidatus Sericytochromatia bacterium]
MEAVKVQFFDSRLDDRLPGRATFRAREVVVRLDDGQTHVLPYVGAQVSLGGSADATPILTLAVEPPHYVRLYLEDRDFAAKLDPGMPEAVRRPLARLSGHAKLGRGKPVAIALALALAGVLAWQGTFWAFDAAVSAVPPAWEVKLGEALAEGETAGAIEDAEVTGAIAAITDRLMARLPADQPYRFQFHAVADAQENAFALPGGQVLITSALIAAAETPDEVAGVLGHEIQHVLGRHSFRRMAKELGLTFVFAAMFGDVGVIAAAGKNMIGLSFDREQELESDRVGLRLAYEAGFEPGAMTGFFRRMQKEGEGEQVLALLSTHPAHGDRLAQIDRFTREWPEKRAELPLRARWEAVRARARALTPGAK